MPKRPARLRRNRLLRRGPSFLRGLGDLAKVTAVSVALNSALLGVLWRHFG